MWKTLKYFLKRKREKQQYCCAQYKNLPKDEKQKSFKYGKNIIEWEKMLYYNYNDLESSFNEEYKDVLKNQFWSLNLCFRKLI